MDDGAMSTEYWLDISDHTRRGQGTKSGEVVK
jgi:hypothetical protein